MTQQVKAIFDQVRVRDQVLPEPKKSERATDCQRVEDYRRMVARVNRATDAELERALSRA